MENRSLIDRLNEWQRRTGVKNSELAQLLGTNSPQTITNWKNRDSGVSKDFVRAVEALVETDGLAEATAVIKSQRRGASPTSQPKLARLDRDILIESVDPGPTVHFVEIDWANGALSAGPGATAVDYEERRSLAFSETWLKKKGFKRKHLVIIEVVGESMEPRLSNGDVALINTHDKEIKDHRIYALRYGDDLRIKRLSRRYDGAVVISSDNPLPEFRDEIVPAADLPQLQILGRAVWVGGELL
tara:strand:- start:8900 stop:9631 length:732 start_codon:yes stop_codon:yes gene_type:complete